VLHGHTRGEAILWRNGKFAIKYVSDRNLRQPPLCWITDNNIVVDPAAKATVEDTATALHEGGWGWRWHNVGGDGGPTFPRGDPTHVCNGTADSAEEENGKEAKRRGHGRHGLGSDFLH
jgi:hypothetical protein